MDTPSGSKTLADLLAGQYDLDNLNHVEKIQKIHYVIVLQDAMMKQGDLEHTNDWDWRISVVTYDGEVHGTYTSVDPNDDYLWADTMTLPYTVEPGDYESHFARWKFIHVEQFRNDDSDPVDVKVTIDDVAHIIITEA